MKKYTNKILIITLALVLIIFTIQFIIVVNDIKKLANESEAKELKINH
jgi:uncharacterized phage infection (PIP) family protein YhgE